MRVTFAPLDVHHCDCCGRLLRRRALAISEDEDEEPMHYGPVCAANATGYRTSDLVAVARMNDRSPR